MYINAGECRTALAMTHRGAAQVTYSKPERSGSNLDLQHSEYTLGTFFLILIEAN